MFVPIASSIPPLKSEKIKEWEGKEKTHELDPLNWEGIETPLLAGTIWTTGRSFTSGW